MNNEDLENQENPYSTWENRRSYVLLRPVTLEAYCRFLKTLKIILFLVFISLFAFLIYTIIHFLFFQDYEFFLFIDGTELSCILNPKTGEISQND